MRPTTQDDILTRLRDLKPGAVVTAKDLLDLGSREAVDQALSRLSRSPLLTRLGRGLYHVPRVNPVLGVAVPPRSDDIAAALARRVGSIIVPSGATAVNLLGLSTQVPAKSVYLTDGRSRKVRVGTFDFEFRHAAPKELPTGDQLSATIVQALRHLGRGAVDSAVVRHLRRVLPPEKRPLLLRDTKYTTDWIAEAIRKVAEEVPADG